MRINKRPRTTPQRNITHDKRYDSARWRKIRDQGLGVIWKTIDNRKIKVHTTVCIECEKENRTVPATVWDHINNLDKVGERFYTAPCQPLCAHHHAIKSAKERRDRQEGG